MMSRQEEIEIIPLRMSDLMVRPWQLVDWS